MSRIRFEIFSNDLVHVFGPIPELHRCHGYRYQCFVQCRYGEGGERRDAESEVFWNFIIEFDHALQRGTKSSNATKVRPLPPYAAPWLVVLHCLLVHVKASISYSINCRQLLPSEEWPAYRKSGLRDFINIGVVKMTTAVTLVQHFKPLKFNGNCMYLDT
jgi:hypothetical protein